MKLLRYRYEVVEAISSISVLAATVVSAGPALPREISGHQYVVPGLSSSNSDIAQKYSQSVHESDLKGWNETTWGMSDKALQEKFGNAIRPVAPTEIFCLREPKRDCKGITQWVLSNFEIGSHKYDVNFEFLNNQLQWVFIRKEKSPEAIGSFIQLSEMLKDKYGPPTDINNQFAHVGLRSMEWKLPSTEINIYRIEKTADDSSFGLNYQPRKAPDPRI